MAVKGYFGLGARTFGNPDGNTSGNGEWSQGKGGGGGGGGTFTPRTSPLTHAPTGIAAGNGLVMLTEQVTSAVFTSADGGHTWTARTATPSDVANVSFFGGKWYAGAAATPHRLYVSSDNGASWATINNVANLHPLNNDILVCAGGGADLNGFPVGANILVSGNNNGFAVSADGATFTNGAIETPSDSANAILDWFFFDGTRYVGAGVNEDSGAECIIYQNPATGPLVPPWLIVDIVPNTDNFTIGHPTIAFDGATYLIGIGTGGQVRVAATPQGLSTAANVAIAALAGAVTAPVKSASTWYAFDFNGAVAFTTTPAVAASWAAGALGFGAGQFVLAAIYDAVHASVIAVSSAGAIATVP